MKDNVDLTQDRIFSRPRRGNSFSLRSIFPKKPWNNHFAADDYSGVHQEDKLIAIGNKEQREEHENIRQEVSGEYCDCCGRKLTKYPWMQKQHGLCSECDEKVFADINRAKKMFWKIQYEYQK